MEKNMLIPKVSIIVPIYNVEKYIEQCAISLFEQDFDDIEYIFVNDCTPDNSVAILENLIEKYPNRKPHIKIIHHKENKGLGSARKTGIENATGDYTIHIDSDDWCELDMISELYRKAIETGADIVVSDFYENKEQEQIYNKQICSSSMKENIKYLLLGNMHGSVCNKLILKDLYFKNNLFPSKEINLLEDLWISVRFFTITDNISYIPKAFLHYRQDNTASLTKQMSEKSWCDLMYFTDTTEIFFKERNLLKEIELLLQSSLTRVRWGIGKFSFKKFKERIIQVSPKSLKLKYIWTSDCRFKYKIRYTITLLMVKLGI